MNWLSPWYIPAAAAALTVPPLVLLYFLKLKRRQVPISSTLLWRKAAEDLRVNSPFQRLRANLLLLLQLLILAAGIAALAEPVISAKRTYNRTIVLLVDQSASMAARESDGRTRLAIAREQALDIVNSMTSDQRAMVIAFAGQARLLCPFTGNKSLLRRAVESVEQTDAPGHLGEAVTLAEVHSAPPEGMAAEDPANAAATVSSSHLVLLSDGRLPDAGEVTVQRGTMEFVRIGQATDNCAVVGLDVRRNYETPAQLTVLARVRNFGAAPVTRDLALYLDGKLRDTRTLEDIPASRPKGSGTTRPAGELGERVVPMDLTLETGAYLEVRLSGSDALAADDRAYAVVTAPQSLRLLLVTPGNRFLQDLMRVMPAEQYQTWTPQEYEQAEENKLVEGGRCAFDVVVFDDHSTGRLPPGNYFFFGGTPLIDGVEAGAPVEGGVLLDWDDSHPVLQHTTVESLHAIAWAQMKLPADAITLIEATNGPVLSVLRRDRNQYLISAISIFNRDRTNLNTDFVFNESIVPFIYDSLRFLAGNSTAGQAPPVTPGEAFSVPVPTHLTSATVRRPDGTNEKISVGGLNLASYGRTDKVGIYTVDQGLPDDKARAVSLLDELESYIAPNTEFRMASGAVQAAAQSDLHRRPLWPYVLMAFGVVAMIEWFVYARRVYV